MPYTTQKDIEVAAGGRDALIALTDQSNTNTTIDLEVLAIFQAKADAFINGYLRARYATPLANPSREIVDCAAELAVYFLRQARPSVGLSERDVEAHKLRLKWLDDVRDGRIRPDEPLPAKSTAVRTVFVENNGPVSRRTMR
jgi:phage gp36-like protein